MKHRLHTVLAIKVHGHVAPATNTIKQAGVVGCIALNTLRRPEEHNNFLLRHAAMNRCEIRWRNTVRNEKRGTGGGNGYQC